MRAGAVVLVLAGCAADPAATTETSPATETGPITETGVVPTESGQGSTSSDEGDTGSPFECALGLERTGTKVCGENSGKRLCFTKTQEFPLEGRFGFLAHVADVDSDGRDDVILRETQLEKTWLLRSTADCGAAGGFVRSTIFADATANAAVDGTLLLDANEDGFLDVLVQLFDLSGQGRRAVIFLSHSDGEDFAEAILVEDFVFGSPHAAADIDRDGHVDLVVASPWLIDIFYGDGLGNFPELRSLDVPGYPQMRTGVADMNGDEFPDLISQRLVGDAFESRIVLLFGDPAQGYDKRSEFAVEHDWTPNDMVVADFDRDGDLDFTFASGVYYGDGAGGVAAVEIQPTIAGSISADYVDGDEWIDLVTSDDILLNAGGKFAAGTTGLERNPEVLPGDVDGDGITDLVVVLGGPGIDRLTVYLGTVE